MAAATKEAAGMDRAALKKALVIARQQPVNAAFAIGADGKAIILLDKMKKGPALDKEIKSQAADAKNHRFGTVAADGDDPKLARFMVNKAGGGLARKLIVALKGTGFSKVELVLEDGSAVESEQGADDDDAAGIDGAIPQIATMAPPKASAADDDTDGAAGGGQAPAPPLDAGSLSRDLTGLVQQMLGVIAADPTKKAALAELATDAQASLKQGNLTQAAAGIDVLRQALGGASASAGSGDGSADDATDAAATAASSDESDASADDGASDVASAAPSDGSDSSADDGSDAPAADPSARGAADTGLAADADGAADGSAGGPDAGAPDAGALTKSLTDLVKQMLPIIAADPSQQDALKGIAQQAQASLKGGDLTTASGHVDALKQMLARGGVMQPAAAVASPPPKITLPVGSSPAAPSPTIAKARVAWVATRQKVETDLGGLHDAFGKAFKGHPQEGDLTKAFRARVDTVLDKLDESLAHTLDELGSATDPQQRAKLVQEAHDLIKGYSDHVASDETIAQLDTNPFVPLSIQKTMTATLGALAKSIC